MVPIRDFSGLTSSICALARAAARLAMHSLDRCMIILHFEEVEADGAGFRALGPDAMTDRLMGVLGHQPFEFGLGLFVLRMGRLGAGKNASEFRPRIRGSHVDHPYRIDPGFRWLQAEQARALATLHAPPELPLRGHDEMLVERVGVDLDLNPLAAAGNDREYRRPCSHHPHVML